MMSTGNTMYTVADLIEHLKWCNPLATVSTKAQGSTENLYLAMDGASNDNALLLFRPRHEFDDIKIYFKCPKCKETFLELPSNGCWKCGYKHIDKIEK